MLITTKALAMLLLPPGILVVMGLLGLLFLRRTWGRGLIVLSLLLFWVLATEPLRDLLLSPLERHYPALVQQEVAGDDRTAIVLLGGGLYEQAPEYGGVDMLSNHSLMRTAYAADLARTTGYEIYTSGGIVLSKRAEPEALVMQRWLERLGVEPGNIHTEIASRTTWENAARIREALEGTGGRRLLLVTSAMHMPRAMLVFESEFESTGLQVVPAPCDYQGEQQPYHLLDYLPGSAAFSDSAEGLHEYLGWLWYRLRLAWGD